MSKVSHGECQFLGPGVEEEDHHRLPSIRALARSKRLQLRGTARPGPVLLAAESDEAHTLPKGVSMIEVAKYCVPWMEARSRFA